MSTYLVNSASFQARVSILEDHTILLNGTKTRFDIKELSANCFSVVTNGHSLKVIIQKSEAGYHALFGSFVREFVLKSERELLLESYENKSDTVKHRLEVRAPMPALVVQIEVEVGDSIEAGHSLVKLEAMKMENELKAHQSGRVKQIHVAKGDTVEKGELLIVLE